MTLHLFKCRQGKRSRRIAYSEHICTDIRAYLLAPLSVPVSFGKNSLKNGDRALESLPTAPALSNTCIMPFQRHIIPQSESVSSTAPAAPSITELDNSSIFPTAMPKIIETIQITENTFAIIYDHASDHKKIFAPFRPYLDLLASCDTIFRQINYKLHKFFQNKLLTIVKTWCIIQLLVDLDQIIEKKGDFKL